VRFGGIAGLNYSMVSQFGRDFDMRLITRCARESAVPPGKQAETRSMSVSATLLSLYCSTRRHAHQVRMLEQGGTANHDP
jgi:hypothetical protein